MKANFHIIKKKSPIHGIGIYAKKWIPKGTKIVEYVGEKVTKTESDRRGPQLVKYARDYKELGAVYLFELNKRYDIDGYVPYNIAKYINHSCDSNCEVDIIRGHIWIIALRDIVKGEELFYNYGYDDFNEFKDHPCRCGSKRCVGYIMAEEHWPRLKNFLISDKI